MPVWFSQLLSSVGTLTLVVIALAVAYLLLRQSWRGAKKEITAPQEEARHNLEMVVSSQKALLDVKDKEIEQLKRQVGALETEMGGMLVKYDVMARIQLRQEGEKKRINTRVDELAETVTSLAISSPDGE
jgi:hypothetical protein